jgi:micrococcal nuclease
MPRPLLLVPLLLLACGSDDGREKGTVVSVHDGDTVTLDDGRKIRYLGVDTPETDQDQCFAQEARKFNESLVLNREVTLEFDDGPAENNGRVLAYVWLSAGGADRLVSEELLRQGYGKLCVIPPA